MGKLIYIRFQSHQCDLQVGQLIHFAGKEVLGLLFFKIVLHGITLCYGTMWFHACKNAGAWLMCGSVINNEWQPTYVC